MIITPKNWLEFQHYKDRVPPWIKLHRSLLDDYEFHCLPVASRALAPMLWLLASESTEGKIDADPKRLAFRLRTSSKEVEDALKSLISAGFFVVEHGASELLAERKQDACLETETETETESAPRASKRATRVPDDWFPSPDGVEIAKSLGMDTSRTMREVEVFRDYWRAKPGTGGTKLDWDATWRNWIRRAAEQKPPPQRQGDQFAGAL